jgi:glutamate/tyrosine decarboxylase-like PLP-dependent enzyme
MAISPTEEYLAWFLGPKAENSQVLEDNILLALRDYIHWRRNYFPGDKILVTQEARRDLSARQDTLTQNVIDMTAELRRNFPFYSPRYIGHQLSDTSLPGVIGYMAGMLFNANNVTTEAAPVTVEWEIQACGRILKMLGYESPPEPPTNRKEYKRYIDGIQSDFGWAHITHGGTTATIEALWFARTVRYMPLAIHDAALKYNLPILLPRALGKPGERDLRKLGKRDLFLMRPDEAIGLLRTYVSAAERQLSKSSKDAINLLDEVSPFAPANGIGACIAQFPPVIFTSGAAHYSVAKAAHILGLGRNAISHVAMDTFFRLDVSDLKQKIALAVQQGKVPLAVVAMAGTTEEGAVDPIDGIVKAREDFEDGQIATFWLHVDAAWGGYFRSLFRWSDTVIDSLGRGLDIGAVKDLASFHDKFMVAVQSRLAQRRGELRSMERAFDATALLLTQAAEGGDVSTYVAQLAFLKDPPWAELVPMRGLTTAGRLKLIRRHRQFDGPWVAQQEVLQRLSDILRVDPAKPSRAWNDLIITRLRGRLRSRFGVVGLEAIVGREEKDLRAFVAARNQDNYASRLRDVFHTREWLEALKLTPDHFRVTAKKRLETAQSYVQDTIDLGYRTLTVQWPFKANICKAFVAFSRAESITIDPHKMGYVPYPCGVIAYRNDRVRHFVLEDAPYITSARRHVEGHQPPRHLAMAQVLEWIEKPGAYSFKLPKIEVDAFAPFILEGSRPGAAAAALWMSLKTMPLTMREHGSIVRASLLAARTLYEWIARWENFLKSQGEEAHYRLITLTTDPPDTNIVTFVVQPKESPALQDMNALTTDVYERFSIQAELGARQHSYSQPYFLSHSSMNAPIYPFASVRGLLDRCAIREARTAYAEHGVVILRAAVMNPYLHALQRLGVTDVLRDFMTELHQATERVYEERHKHEPGKGPLIFPPG